MRTESTPSSFRRMALAMKGVVEGAHMNHPDFRVNGRIFATLREDGKHGMVKVSLDDQARLLADSSGAFTAEAGAWGRAGCTRVRLDAIGEEVLGEALTLAWQRVAADTAKSPTRARTRKART